jgi:hypothetical protein
MANYYGQGEGSQPAGGGKGYDPGKGKEKDGKGKDKGKGKGKEKDGKAKDKDRGWPLFDLYKRCDGWCDRVSPPPRCVRPCNEIQDIRFPEHPGPHMCRECAGGEENASPAPDEEDEVENHAS